ncbi:MAG: tRNA threonylcarbamoyladenosine biosynthesis protein TsaB [Paraglaciecola sp.]|jgi:tRNA threonylcarbamoyladenosine biosynthesis protein TsaB
MNLLVIDTATEACSVALEIDGELFHRFEICPQQHSQRLLPMINEVLTQANISLGQLDYLGFGRGPGSFTGVRIATSMSQGLALGAGLPVVGVSTLAAMAQQALEQSQGQDIFSAIDARMSEVYFARYEAQEGVVNLVGEEQVLPPEEAHKLLAFEGIAQGVGTGWAAYPQLMTELAAQDRLIISEDILYPDARFMLPLVKQCIERGQAQEAGEIQPVYLRDKVTWKKLPGKE